MVFGFCACGRGRYYAKEKWTTPASQEFGRLKGSPCMVRESVYEDTIQTGRTREYFEYTFDREGNVVGSRELFGDSLEYVSTFSFDDGFHMKRWGFNPLYRDTMRRGLRALGGGWFKSYKSRYSKDEMTYLIRFSKEGDEVVMKGYRDSAAEGTPNQQIFSFYRGQRLLRRIIRDSGAISDQRCFYSAGDSPDSVVWVSGGRVVRRELFRNNRWGDPVVYLNIEDQDTLDADWYSYVYDGRANWTRRRDSARRGAGWITEREIVY
jgi:hypothetical protein